MAGLGAATVADGSTEGPGSPCCSLRRVDAARLNGVGHGLVRPGRAR